MSHALRSIVLVLFAVVFMRAPVRLFNPLMRRIFGGGLPLMPSALLTVRGRTSGQPRSFPVATLEVGGRLFVQASYGDVDWVRNVRASGDAVVKRGRDSEKMDAIELPPETSAAIIRDALAPYRRSRLVRAVVGPVLRPPVGVLRLFRIRIDETLEDYVADARRHPLFELRRRPAAANREALRRS